jgi:ATP-dependent Clp protease ATP-binding subunit ClpB
VDFKNTVVIMTSNVGSHFISAADLSVGLTEGVRREVLDALRDHFRPEFLNRIDEIIVFHALNRDQMRQIVDIQLRGLMKRLEDRKIRIELADRAKDLVIEEGYDPAYGARPLKRTIQRAILDPLALRVLQGDFKEGDTIRIDAPGGKIQFERVENAVHA